MYNKITENYKLTRKPILVLGAGISGIAATKLLAHNNLAVILFDDNANLTRPNLEYKNIITQFGTDPKKLFNQFSSIILSPGISQEHKLITYAKKNNLLILSELDLAYSCLENNKIKLIGITGTNGKSTTTKLLELFLSHGGKNIISAGNIGTPLSTIALHKPSNYDYIILELSSFQLELTKLIKLDMGVILNISPNHLDRHKNLPEYIQAKLNIFNITQNKNLCCAHNSVKKYINRDQIINIFSDTKNLNTKNLQIPKHLDITIQHAAYLAKLINIPENFIVKALTNFSPLPHRLEFIAKKNNIKFINDSKSTTVASVCFALKSLSKPTHLILGGLMKEPDFSAISAQNYKHIKSISIFGQDREKIFKQINFKHKFLHQSLDKSFANLIKISKPGEIILLSPGCASFDQFKNFADRGNYFKKLCLEF